MGISKDSWHKRRKTGGRRPAPHKKRKYEMGRPSSMTKLGPRRVRPIRVRGGNYKFRGLRLDTGGYSWGSEAITKKTKIIDVMYNAANNELVRTKTLTKNTIVMVDATPFKQWYESYYGKHILGKKKQPEKQQEGEVKKSKRVLLKHAKRAPMSKIEQAIEEQLAGGKILACISSRPGKVGKADGYILEGKELEFYSKKIRAKKIK